MADDNRMLPKIGVSHFGAERSGTFLNAFGGLGLRGPPGFVEMGEIMRGPGGGQRGAGGADVAGKVEAFADARMHVNLQAEGAGERLGRLQGSGIGRGENPLDTFCLKRFGGGFGLGLPKWREPWVGDPRVSLGGGEVQVEFALAVTEQDHAAAASAETAAGQSAPAANW